MSETSVDVYKDLICSMIRKMSNERFIKQIYGIIYRENRREVV